VLPNVQDDADLVSDALKSARIAHDLLIGLLAIVFAAGLVSRETTQPYLAAIAQLDALSEVKSQMDEMMEEVAKFLDQDNSYTAEVAAVTRYLNRNGFKVSKVMPRPSEAFPIKPFLPPFNENIESLRKWFEDGPSNGCRVKRLPLTWKKDGSIDEVALEEYLRFSGLHDGGLKWVDGRDIVLDRWKFESATVSSTSPTGGDWPGNIQFCLITPGEGRMAYLPGVKASTWTVDLGQPFARLKQSGLIKKLRDPDGTWLPALLPFWEEVSRLTVHSAKRNLKEKLETVENRFTLVGATVDLRSFKMFAPIVASALLAFIWFHLRLLNQASSYPAKFSVAWIPIYSGSAAGTTRS
jgi:hypothetical protein